MKEKCRRSIVVMSCCQGVSADNLKESGTLSGGGGGHFAPKAFAKAQRPQEGFFFFSQQSATPLEIARSSLVIPQIKERKGGVGNSGESEHTIRPLPKRS